MGGGQTECIMGNWKIENSVAPSLYKPHTTHNSSIYSDEGLMLETSIFKSLYDDQFTLSTPHRYRSTTVSLESYPLCSFAM